MGSKQQREQLVINDNVLGLFTALDIDHGSDEDLDDHVADLLYFIVDLLQFSGETNAYDEIDFDSMSVEVLEALQNRHSVLEGEEIQHVVLILDKKLQKFPWESMPCLQNVSTSRVGSMQSLRECIQAMSRPSRHCVNGNKGTYILNPSGDLPATQATLEPILSTLSSSSGSQWGAIINRAPDEATMTKCLRQSSINLYFGHGGGTQYIRPRSIKRLDRCSEVVWLMGCSSGAVSEHGDLEPFAVPNSYLLAGTCVEDDSKGESVLGDGGKCLSVVSTLWDVTDKDIDRFSVSVGEEWGLWTSSKPQKPQEAPLINTNGRKHRRAETPTTPRQASKTPRTPKVPTASATKTPIQSTVRTEPCAPGVWSLAEAVNRSRDACYLRYLNGAATVVYGVPVYLEK